MEDSADTPSVTSHPRASTRGERRVSRRLSVDTDAREQGRGPLAVTVAQLSEFDEVIDVRSEGEYGEDHIPGAINCPVLDNSERALIGTIYKQSSSFDAKKAGAALVAANIARHIRERFQDRPRT